MMRVTSLLLAALVVSVSAPAAASATFPEAIRKELGLVAVPNTPGCQLCHKSDVGGLMTVTKPFGRAVIKVGATAASVPSLKSALGTLESDGTDSDGDGSSDIAELRAGTDPNAAEVSGEGGAASVVTPQVEEVPLPETGCSMVNLAAPASGSLTTLGLVALALFRRRRTR